MASSSEICTRLMDVLYSNSSSICSAVEDNLVKFHKLLQERHLVGVAGERNYDALIEQFCASLDLSEPEDVEQTCQDFLSSMLLLGTEESIELSRILRKKLNSRAVEIGLSDSFLSREMLPKEEIALLQKELIKPLHLEETQEDLYKEKFQDHSNPANKSIEVLQKYSQQIVSIISTEDIAMQFAKSLCEAMLVAPAMIDQVEKIENKSIQAKTIMGEVRTIIQRGVIPEMLMEKFVGVLMHYSSHFKDVIDELIKELKWPNTDRCCLQSKHGHGSDLPPLAPLQLNNSHVTNDPYRRYLNICYQSLQNVDLYPDKHSSPREWTYFDLASTEHSVAETNTSGEVLDLRQLPQEDSIYPSHTLIIGAPGVGKSSIIIELCRRWINKDPHVLEQYKYVILVQGDSQPKSLADIVPDEKLLLPIQKANGHESLFIIDGYDELSERCRCFVDRFIQRKIWHNAALIVTTRSSCAKMISEIHFPNRIEILGFTPQGKKGYIRHFLKDDNDFLFLQQASTERCWSIPLYLTTLIIIFKDEEKKMEQPRAPFTSVTKIYGALIRTLVRNFVKKHDSPDLSKYLPPSYDIAPGEFFNFPMPIYKPFLELCVLSYKSLSNGLASLNAHDELDKRSVTFDLLSKQTIETTSSSKTKYRFLHPSIGEYLAAYCISRMEPGEREQCIHNLKQSKQYSLVLEFLHGFGCVDAKQYEVKQYEAYHNFDIFRQLCEAESCDLIRSVYKGIPNEERICSVCRTFPSPTPADFWCLGRVIALSDCDWDLGFTLRPVENDHLKHLNEGIQSVERPTGRIRKMRLSLTSIDQNGLCYAFQINETCLSKLQEIQLFKNHLTGDVIPLLCASLPKLPNFRKFLFHYNEIQAGGHKELILALAKCRALEHLALTGLLPEECKLLLTTMQCLKVIEFWHISANSCKASFDCLPNSNVEQLQIYGSHINPTIAENLPQTLPASKVRHLKLINCAINCETVGVIVTAAEQARCLQSIDLSDNCIEDEGGDMLLRLCSHLKLLDSYKFNDFSPEMCKELKKKI